MLRLRAACCASPRHGIDPCVLSILPSACSLDSASPAVCVSVTAAYEGRIRAQKLRVELAAAKKEAEHYIGRAELAKKLEHRDRAGAGGSASGKSAGGKGRAAEGATDAEGSTADPRFAKKPRRGDDEGRDSRFGGASSSGDAAPRGEVGEDGLRRHFKQRAPLEDKLLTRKGR
jgi:hypothetical protein